MQDRQEPRPAQPSDDVNGELRNRLSGRPLQERRITAELRELMVERRERAEAHRRSPRAEPDLG
jgi:hypothetical protein